MKEKDVFSSRFNRSYKIPDGYFEDLENRMVRRLREEKQRKRKLIAGINLVAALFLMIILLKTAYNSWNNKPSQGNVAVLSELTEEDIEEYILMEYDSELDLILENNL